jgi:hypothetical protein
MNLRFLSRNDRLARLAELYRAAEEGAATQAIDPDLRAAFDADRHLIDALGDRASSSLPASPAIGRARLLAEVAARSSESPERNGQPSMIGKLLTGRALALIATACVFAGGAATVGASGGVGGAADRFTSFVQAAHFNSSSNDATATPVDNAALAVDASETPEATETGESGERSAPHGCTPTPVATVDTSATATDTPAATDTAVPTTTASAEDHGNGPRNGDCDVKGIPTTNSHFTPDANGTCEPGESAIKTTPSGVMVNVPCEAIDHSNNKPDQTPPPADGSATPEAAASGADHADGNRGGKAGDHSQDGDHRP